MMDDIKETLKFYAINDYLLINGILWNESDVAIHEIIYIINQDGRAVLQEAMEMGFDVRFNCSKEEGEQLYQLYQKRFPVIENEEVKKQIVERAYQDIKNMKTCLEPLETDMVLYRNIKTKYIEHLEEGEVYKCYGFSSCSLYPHIAENAMYGSSGCSLVEIVVPKGILAIRMDLMKDIQNEKDEVILGPMEFRVTKVDKENNKYYMLCIK